MQIGNYLISKYRRDIFSKASSIILTYTIHAPHYLKGKKPSMSSVVRLSCSAVFYMWTVETFSHMKQGKYLLHPDIIQLFFMQHVQSSQ